MPGMDSYSKTVMERAMKVQEVLLRAIAKKITWWQAAEILVSVIGTCGAGENVTRSMAMTDCSIAGEANLMGSRIVDYLPANDRHHVLGLQNFRLGDFHDVG